MNDQRSNESSGAGTPNPTPDHPPPQAMAQPLQKKSRRGSGRHRSSSSKRKLKHTRILAGLLLVLLVPVAVTTVLIYFKMQQYRNETNRLEYDLRVAERDLASAREKITEMQTDQRILLANRIPGITALIMNRQIHINDRYVRSITFIQPGLGEGKTIEFSSVLNNSDPDPVLPKVEILLFDEAGLQTGAIQLDSKQTISPVAIPEMLPGETRTYSGVIELQRKTPSKYFVVNVN
ncbi:MAG: hypothetical protein WBG92_14275 [Thiohalocapsa sp.]